MRSKRQDAFLDALRNVSLSRWKARTDQRKSSLKKVDKSFKDAGRTLTTCAAMIVQYDNPLSSARSGQRLRFDNERVNTANLAEQNSLNADKDSKAASKCAKDAAKDTEMLQGCR